MEKILVTGATGYIGKRMISIIVSQGYKAICCCRDANRFEKVMELDDKNKIGQKALLRPKDLWARL
ncbi:NAD-dependent epimerase/dehydratase family protein [Chryseobacterium sp. S0630]|uniref:NAD-dependent epimerase/dehydratase family protein n=1 Tax=Chryseobacterium sp. S0630 TaxID=2957803 RepID=UPI0020A19217|nr:NAD-dependent epimerase/dehydratase family protein [Chryseobacterium sp. S0630]MCP1297913.1 NAD-dependent epimerase/dehydratase family protein [Chryseobacterium sp. S0630]